MGRWDYKVQDISGSPVAMTNALAGEQVKDIKETNEGTGMLKSTRSEDGRPQDLTIYNLSEILQGTPAFAGVGNTLGVLQTTLDIGLGNLGKTLDAADFLLGGIIPDDVKDFVEAARDAVTGESSSGGGTGGSALAAQSAQDIIANPNIQLSADAKADLEAGRVAPSIMAVVKIIADNVPVYWMNSYRKDATVPGGSPSDHSYLPARAIDFRPDNARGDMRGKHDDWTRKVYSIIESMPGQRPYQMIGPVKSAWSTTLSEKGTWGGTDKHGTWWGHNSDHYDHIHLGMKVADLLEPAPAAGGATGSTGTTGSGGAAPDVPVPAGKNAAISAVDVARLLKNATPTAGFAGENLAIMVAISKGESGFRPGRYGDLKLTTGTWGPSVGLFQIRTVNKERGTGGVRDIQKLLGSDSNPPFSASVDSTTPNMAAQAASAWSIAGSGKLDKNGRHVGFNQWTIYNGGIYKQFLTEARAAVAEIGG